MGNEKQVSVGVERNPKGWLVRIGEKGNITDHQFAREEDARAFAAKEERRLGIGQR
jgi:hypothetical protein